MQVATRTRTVLELVSGTRFQAVVTALAVLAVVSALTLGGAFVFPYSLSMLSVDTFSFDPHAAVLHVHRDHILYSTAEQHPFARLSMRDTTVEQYSTNKDRAMYCVDLQSAANHTVRLSCERALESASFWHAFVRLWLTLDVESAEAKLKYAPYKPRLHVVESGPSEAPSGRGVRHLSNSHVMEVGTLLAGAGGLSAVCVCAAAAVLYFGGALLRSPGVRIFRFDAKRGKLDVESVGWLGGTEPELSISLSAIKRVLLVMPKRARMMACRLVLEYQHGKKDKATLELAQYHKRDAAQRMLSLIESVVFPDRAAERRAQRVQSPAPSAAEQILASDAKSVLGNDGQGQSGTAEMEALGCGLDGPETAEGGERATQSEKGVRRRKKKKRAGHATARG